MNLVKRSYYKTSDGRKASGVGGALRGYYFTPGRYLNNKHLLHNAKGCTVVLTCTAS